jgi:hypothetical protein
MYATQSSPGNWYWPAYKLKSIVQDSIMKSGKSNCKGKVDPKVPAGCRLINSLHAQRHNNIFLVQEDHHYIKEIAQHIVLHLWVHYRK